jgi:ADP-heptose:LPS heptosyltransferase
MTSQLPGPPASKIDLDALGDSPRIVVVVRDHMSGVLYSVPALRALKRRWPAATITLLTSGYSAPILGSGTPYTERILPLYSFADEPGPFDRLRDIAGKAGTWLRLVGRVDLVVHLRHVGGGSLAFCASLGKPKQIGYKQGSRFDRLLDTDLGWADNELGSRQRNKIIIEGLGIEPAGDHLELWLSDADRSWARSWLSDRGHEDGTPVTIIHPGCHWGCNQWLTDRWAETANRVLAEKGGSVVITGVAREQQLADRIVEGVHPENRDRVLDATGETSLTQFAAIIGASDLVLAVDASPTQICQALDVPAVVLMGAGNQAWNGPVPGERMTMLQEWDNDNPRPEICDWASGACNGPNCSTRLEEISVTQVLDNVEQLLR